MSPESGNFLPKVARKWHKCGKDLPLKKGIDSYQKYFRKKNVFFKNLRLTVVALFYTQISSVNKQ